MIVMETWWPSFLLAFFLCCSVSWGAVAVDGGSTRTFGRYPAKERKTAKFILRNSGKEAVEIVSVRKTCGCAEAAADRDRIEAGGTATVEVSILGDSIYGVYRKTTYVMFAGGGSPLKLTVSGEAFPVARISPSREVRLGLIPAGKELRRSFMLEPAVEGLVFGEPKGGGAGFSRLEFKKGLEGAGRLDVWLKVGEVGGKARVEVEIPVENPEGWKPLKVKLTGEASR